MRTLTETFESKTNLEPQGDTQSTRAGNLTVPWLVAPHRLVEGKVEVETGTQALLEYG